jgi:hypothetical protein
MDGSTVVNDANQAVDTGEDTVRLRLSKVNEILRYLMTLPYHYAEPAVRELKAEVERCNGG